MFHTTKFGLALGITWGVIVFLMGMLAWLFGFGADLVPMMAHAYHGYAASFIGAVNGAFWGFIYGYVFGVVLAHVYNRLCCHCDHKKKK